MPTLSDPGLLQGEFCLYQVVVVINRMTRFEVIFECNIVLELCCFIPTFDFDEGVHGHLLNWTPFQSIVGQHYFHYTIRILKK